LTDLRNIFHVVMTRLTLVDKTRLFLKWPDLDKNRRVAFDSFTTKKVSHGKETCECVNDLKPDLFFTIVTTVNFFYKMDD
jgi:hypothetical protein